MIRKDLICVGPWHQTMMALPNMGNIFINLIKSTSLAFAVKVVEIVAISRMIANQGYNFLEMDTVAAIIYWVMCLLLEVLFYYLERKLGKHKRETIAVIN